MQLFKAQRYSLTKFILFVWLSFFVFGCRSNCSDIVILDNYKDALEQAAKTQKNIILIFDFLGNPTGTTHNLICDYKFKKYKDKYIVLVLLVDRTDEAGPKNLELQRRKFGTNTQPTYYIINEMEQIINGPLGYDEESSFWAFLEQ